MGAPGASPGPARGVGITGEGAGQVLAPQSLEGYSPKKRKRKKRLSKAEGVYFVLSRWPHLSVETAERIYMRAAHHRTR
jgi:hypothetical protein